MFQPSSGVASGRSRRFRVIAVIVGVVAILLSGFGVANATTDPATGKPDPYKANMSDECASPPAATKLKGFDVFQFFVTPAGSTTPKSVPVDKRIINDYVTPGSTVTLKFKLKQQCAGTYVALNVYQAPEATYVEEHASQQKHAPGSPQHGVYPAGQLETLSVKVPDCYYQLDVNTGHPYKVGDYTLDDMGRLLLTANGGTKKCTTPPPTTHKPAAEEAQTCSTDATGWDQTFINKGNVAEEFTVKVGGKALPSETVAAGKTLKKQYSFEEVGVKRGDTARIVVSANGKDISSASVKNDCSNSAVDISKTCDVEAGQGAILSFENNGKMAETYTVKRTINGKNEELPNSPITVEPGDTPTEKLARMDEDTTATFTVTANNSGQTWKETVAIDCTQVSPEVIERPTPTPAATKPIPKPQPQLANTGMTFTPFMGLGTFLLLAGTGLLVAARRVRLKYNAY